MRIALTLGAACAAAVLSAGSAAATATAAVSPATTAMSRTTAAVSPANNDSSVIWGTVVSGPDLKVRDEPTTGGAIVAKLPYGSQDRVECVTHGTAVHGDPHWYWLAGVRGWASAAYVDTGGRSVPSCTSADPCPQLHDRDCHHDPCAYRDH
ncbi:SH3 domain-containing protein [Streptomyces sp. NPDC003032]